MASFGDSNRALFHLNGGREMLTASRMEELLSLIPADLDPTMIKLSNKSFSVEAAEIIAGRLKTFQNVVIADISDIIAGRPEEEALQALTIICNSLAHNKLIELNISDNALGCKGVHACSSLLTIKSIERLYICNNGMAAESAVLISEILTSNGCPPLKTLHYYNNMSGNDGAIAISKIVSHCPQLTDFRFSATRSNAVGCIAIAQALETVHDLVRLDLVDNIFSGAAGVTLANALRTQVNLRDLILRDAGLGAANSNSVFEALKTACPKLRNLDVSGNEFEERQCKALAEYLKLNASALVHFSIDENEIGNGGIIEIANILTPSRFAALETFSACVCEITASGAITLCHRLAKIPSMRFLKIDGNLICERAVVAMQNTFSAAGKEIEALEENDEDGDDDMDEANFDEEDDEMGNIGAEDNDDAAADELASELAKATVA